MKDKDQIQEIFSKKLGNHEAVVRPELWNGIASKIATTTTVTTGVSLVTKIIISTFSIAALTTAVILYSSKEDRKNKTQTSVIEESTGFKEKNHQVNRIEPNQTTIENQANHEILDDKPIIESINTSNDKIKENKSIVSTTETTTNDSLPIGVLKERQEELVTNEYNAEDLNNSTDLKTKDSITKTEFPIALDEDHLVESYSIVKMPDVFSPNNDGKNDFLFIESEGISNFSIVIIDEKSNIIYKSTDSNFKWNGFDLYGNPAPTGKYIYFITGNDRKGNPVNKYQSLTLVR